MRPILNPGRVAGVWYLLLILVGPLRLAYYRLFAAVDRNLAVLVVIFGGVTPALINVVGVVSDFAVLTFVRGNDFLNVLPQAVPPAASSAAAA